MEQTTELKITFTQGVNEGGQITKNIQVNGEALADKFLCYMMLEGARDAIKDHHDRLAASQIVGARMIPNLNGLARGQ